MRRVWQLVAAGVTALAFAAVGCSRGDVPDSTGRITMKGTVHQTTKEDGTPCWQFQSAKGNRYELEPAQVPHELLVDGEQATIVAKTRTGFSYCQVGTIVDVVSASPETGA
jgi:hypothetical protein